MLIRTSDVSYADTKDTLIIGGDENFPPYEYIDEDGEYQGFNVDLMRALSIELKKDIKLVPMDWLHAHAALMDGEIDMIQGMSFNSQRKEIYDFSNPYLLNSSVLFIKKDGPGDLSLEELKGKIVAVQRSDFAAYILAEQGEIELRFVSDLKTAFDALMMDNVYAVFGNKLSGIYVLNKYNLDDKIKIAKTEVNQVDYGIAFKKGNPELVEEINQGLANLKRDGTYNKIYEKWFGSYYPEQRNWKILFYTLSALALIILFFTYISFRWNTALKKEVERQTFELNKANEELNSSKDLLKESDSFKEQIINSLTTGLITFDSMGKITAINSVGINFFGLDRGQALGKKLVDLGLEDFLDIDLIFKCIETEENIIIPESNFVLKDREYYFSYLISPLKAANYKNRGAILSFRDITSEKKMRKELEEQNKMQTLGRFVASIVHEIRNPLSAIKTYLDMLPGKYDNPRFREKITKQVPQEINRLNELLNELLDYAKPTEVIKTKFNLKELIDETIDLLSSSYKNKKIEFKTFIKPEIKILGERNKLKQVFINLILNSIEAIEEEGFIHISAEREEEHVKILIEDNGMGIAEEELDEIFEPFHTSKEEGSGLGLFVCYQYVKNNHGDIEIKSNENLGTTVKVYLKNGDI